MQTLESCFGTDRALVFGIGGGGDIVGSIPTARLLELHDVEVILGGVAFDRLVIDPVPGPRSLAEIDGIEQVSDSVALVTPETQTKDGTPLTETTVEGCTDRPVALLDITAGASGLGTGLEAACRALDIDLVIGIDSGGDVLAAGDEPGLRSPLSDAITLAALADCEIPSLVGVFGYGSDGELTAEEIDEAIGRAARRDGLLGSWGLTPETVEEVESVLEEVTTEASRLPVEAASGRLGTRSIRDGRRTLELCPASTTTFYLDPESVFETSEPASLVANTDSHITANSELNDAGYVTELDRERRRANGRVEPTPKSD